MDSDGAKLEYNAETPRTQRNRKGLTFFLRPHQVRHDRDLSSIIHDAFPTSITIHGDAMIRVIPHTILRNPFPLSGCRIRCGMTTWGTQDNLQATLSF
jgi:hypothetical protein